MVYNYKRKTERASWSESTLREAMNEAKKTSIKGAATKYGISYSVLQRRMKTGSSVKSLGRFKSIFTNDEELELVQHLKSLDSLFYGLTKSEFLRLVGEFAKRKNKQTTFKNNTAGKQWFKNFKMRHPEIVLRTPESTSIARLQAFNRPAVNRFYDLLESLLESEKIRPDMIYNMDETGVRTSSTRPPKVLSVYGKKQVGIVSSLEKGTLTTVICCCSASGNFAPPPFFIFKRKRFQARLLDGALPGCEAAVSDSGWINGEIFLEWLRVFVSYVRPTQDRKALLLLDNHESHKYYPALDYATKNNVIFLSIPPHTSHKLQPLDVAIYSPFKTFFEIEINKFQKQYPGRVMDQYDVAKLVSQAYLRSATPQNALSGFRASGIQPFDRYAIGEEYFAPSAVYNREVQPQEPHRNDHHLNLLQVTKNLPAQIFDEEHEPPAPPCSENLNQLMENIQPTQTETINQNPKNAEVIEQVEVETFPSALSQVDRGTATPPPTIEFLNTRNILQEINPFPQNTQRITKRRRQPQKSEILTSTPVKTLQKDKFEKTQMTKVSTPKPSTSGQKKKKGKEKKEGKGKKKTNHISENIDFFCIICREKYESPPTEDWIQCSQCQEWSHESCSSYSGHGSYFCDICFD
ncbi:uncharacterized protein LOC106138133 [Amyelois transitella]|uniref:uncharacterized protein LOC106138133 n=1 Tax=Amyelois transitella TaxID=680683 RepID=UPI00298FB3AF|nr:uncharacterized protein LOC106138133 [Amyelois transitella]